MSKKRDVPLQLTLKPSVRLTWFMGFVHLLALVACLSSFLPVISKCGLFLAIGIHFWFILERLKNERYTIKYNQVSGWEIAKSQGFVTVNILPSTVITLYALFLHIEIQHTNAHITDILTIVSRADRKFILILADMLEEDEYRRLIVKLKTAAIKQERIPVSVDKI